MKEKIRAMLAERGHTQADLADLLGITYQALSIKMNSHTDFKRMEIYLIMKCYELTADELVDIFFASN
jgi:DNA-binding helix-turn-helix protein